jgi:hypothetical protein
MVQMGWEYPVPPPPSNALMGLMGDGPFAAGAGQPAGLPLQGCVAYMSQAEQMLTKRDLRFEG